MDKQSPQTVLYDALMFIEHETGRYATGDRGVCPQRPFLLRYQAYKVINQKVCFENTIQFRAFIFVKSDED